MDKDMPDLNTLIAGIEGWGRGKDLHKVDPSRQYLKVAEETGEIAAGLARNDIDAVIDAIGDSGVTLIIEAMTLGVSFYDCLLVAYNEIKDRTGEIINDVFVKSEDLPKFKIPDLGESGADMISYIPETIRLIVEEATAHFIQGIKDPVAIENIPGEIIQKVIDESAQAIITMVATNTTFKDEMIRSAKKPGNKLLEPELIIKTKEAIFGYIQALFAYNMYNMEVAVHVIDETTNPLDILERLNIDVEDFKDFASDEVLEIIKEEQEERAKEQDPTKLN